MGSDYVTAKMTLLHCSNLVTDLIEASYLKENGEKNVKGSPLYSKLDRIRVNFSILENDAVRQALAKRCFEYTFPTAKIKVILAGLADDTQSLDCKQLRQILREFNKIITDKEGITRH